MSEPLIRTLELRNFRSYRQAALAFDAPQVVFYGDNGAGKSNLLEAIFFLSILRSFRTSSARELITIGEKAFRLRAGIAGRQFAETLEVEQGAGGGRKLSIDGAPVRRSSEFIREFRCVAFSPEDKLITAGSSSHRRKFFDMLISMLEPAYFTALQRYGAALAQRNAALRHPNAAAAAVAAFEPELAAAIAILAPARQKYTAELEACVRRLPAARALDFSLRYAADYPVDEAGYLARLAAERDRDRKRGYTGSGAQTDDFTILLNGKSLRHFGSNGQQRLISLYLKMAEFELVKTAADRVAVLVDDVTGELDGENRERFFELLGRADQTFYTFTARPEERRFAEARQIALPLL